MFFHVRKINSVELLYYWNMVSFFFSPHRKTLQNVYFSFTWNSGKDGTRGCRSTRSIIVVAGTDLPSLHHNLVNSFLLLCSFSVALSLFILRHFPQALLSQRLWPDGVSLSPDSVSRRRSVLRRGWGSGSADLRGITRRAALCLPEAVHRFHANAIMALKCWQPFKIPVNSFKIKEKRPAFNRTLSHLAADTSTLWCSKGDW